MIISNELLSKVLNKPIESVMHFTEDSTEGTILVFSTDYRHGHINLYELVSKCKQWALTLGYQLHSALRTGAYPVCTLYKESATLKAHFKGDTEPLAVIEACEEIYKDHYASINH